MVEELKTTQATLKTVTPGNQDTTLIEKVEMLERERGNMQVAFSDWKSLAEVRPVPTTPLIKKC